MRLMLLTLFSLVIISCKDQKTQDIIIVMDGEFGDWENVPIVFQDDEDATGEEMDFRTLKATYDEDWLYFYLDLRYEQDLKALDGKAFLLFDADGDRETGLEKFRQTGIDFYIECTAYAAYAKENRGLGMFISTDTSDQFVRRSFYDVQFAQLPTYASTAYELRIKRGTYLNYFKAKQFAIKLVYQDSLGRIKDETDRVEISLENLLENHAPKANFQFEKTDPDLIRFMSWNCANEGILKNPEAYQKIVKVLQPDIIAFHEATFKLTKDTLKAWFEEALNTKCYVAYPEPGGFLKRPIISKFPLQMVQEIDSLSHPIEAIQAAFEKAQLLSVRANLNTYLARALPMNSKTVQIKGKKLLILSLGLRFGGSWDSPEEIIRGFQAEMVRNAIEQAKNTMGIDGVVLGADLNLVGKRTPLDEMVRQADMDGSHLEVITPLHLDGRSKFNWQSYFRETFPHSILDFLIYSGASIEVDRTFLFDTAILPDMILTQYGLTKEDTYRANDHNPMIMDFRMK